MPHSALRGRPPLTRLAAYAAQSTSPPEILADLGVAIAHGSEDRVSDVVTRVLGRPPRSVPAFLTEHRTLLSADRPGRL